jgi:hypothetical protein
MPKTCIIRPTKKFVSGQHQDASHHLDWDDQMTRNILIGKLGSQGKKKKDPLLILPPLWKSREYVVA